MKRQRVLVWLCVLALLLIAGCNLQTEETKSEGVSVTPKPTVDNERQELIRRQLSAIPVVTPANGLLGGFSYYDDNSLPAGRDPLFAVCQGKAARLMQNGDGWNIEHISLEDLAKYHPLQPTGQRSDYMHYIYLPSLGEIHLVDDLGNDLKLVVAFHNEYDPEYWIWAWSSLVFIKDCHLRVFYIRPDGSSHFYRFDM